MFNESHLPSIKALRTFIAVANNMSFSKAANELCVTQGAVSKQISALEQQIGQPLLERQINGVQLTSAGQRYLPKIIEALEIIQYATENLVLIDQAKEVLTLNVTPSFASLWLIPKISDFSRVHQNIDVRIRTGDGVVKNGNGDADVMIRCLPVSSHYENASLFRHEKLLLVGSTKELALNPIKEIGDLLNYNVIPHITRPHLWEQFKRTHELTGPFQFTPIGYEHFYMSLEAVKEGAGLALLPDFMVRQAIENGELSNPLQLSINTSYGYYMIVPSYRLSSRKIYEFTKWVTAGLKE